MKIRRMIVMLTVVLMATTAAGAGDELCFIHMADTQLGMGEPVGVTAARFGWAVAQINAMEPQPDFVIICGDLLNTPSPESAAAFRREADRLRAPLLLMPGNHDIGDKADAERLAFYRSRFGPDYYAATFRGVRIIVLNSLTCLHPTLPEETDVQREFFAEQLRQAEAGKQPVIVAGHYPPFFERADEKSSWMNMPEPLRSEFLKQCMDHGVKLLLCGHTHRTARRNHGPLQLLFPETLSVNEAPEKRPHGYRVAKFRDGSLVSWEFVPVPAN